MESKTKTVGAHLRLLCACAFIFISLLLAPIFPAFALDETKPDLVLTILHTNDIHSHDQSFVDNGKLVGGMSRIGYLIGQFRKTTPNLLVIDGGDIFQGTPFYQFYHGQTEVAMLNLCGYDIYTIGNHEFDNGPDNLAKQLRQAKFDIISANLDCDSTPQLKGLVHPYVVKQIEGKKVGFVGAITPELVKTELTTAGVKVLGAPNGTLSPTWMDPIAKAVKALKDQGVTRIILVTHVGVELDKKLAQSLADVDAIVGGHSHTLLAEPVIIKRADGSSCVIVQSGSYGRYLGKLTLAFDGEGQVILSQSKDTEMKITENIPEDGKIAAYLKSRSAPVEALEHKVIGFAGGTFAHSFKQCTGDSPIGDVICDALAEEAAPFGATITFQNRGGIREAIEPGALTVAKVDEILPFENKLTIATVPGATILSVLEHSLKGPLGASFLDVHGLKILYDPQKPAGQKVVYVEAADSSGNYKRLNPEATYRIALNGYTFSGGEGYNFAGATDVVTAKQRLSEVFADYVSNHKKIYPQKANRILAVSSDLSYLDQRNGKNFLCLKHPFAGFTVTIVCGSNPGVDALKDSTLVPLDNPQKLGTTNCPDNPDNCRFELPASGQNNEHWVTMIVRGKYKEAKGEMSLVASPLEVKGYQR